MLASSLNPPTTETDVLASFEAYVDTLPRIAGVARWDAFDICDVAAFNPEIVPHLWMVGFRRSGDPYFLVVGSALQWAQANAVPGRPVAEARNGGWARLMIVQSVNRRVTERSHNNMILACNSAARCEDQVRVPFCSKTGEIVRLMGCSVFEWRAPTAASRRENRAA